MYRKTAATLAALATLLWAAAIYVFGDAVNTGMPMPLFGPCAITGATLALGSLILFIHGREMASRAAAMRALAAGLPAPAAATAEAACDDLNGPTVAFARRGDRTAVPAPRIYVARPDLVHSSPTVEMIPARDATDKIAKAYSIGDANGYDRAVADMAGIKLSGDGQ